VRKIKDINSSFTLYAVCVGCARMEPLSAERLIEELGADILLEDVRKRLRCKGCGERSGDIRIVYVGPCRSAAGFHYRR
jgi:hypothetical protein